MEPPLLDTDPRIHHLQMTSQVHHLHHTLLKRKRRSGGSQRYSLVTLNAIEPQGRDSDEATVEQER